MNVIIDTSKIKLETARLILRPFYMDDLADFFEYASVPGVGEMAGWPHHKDIDTSKRILESFIEDKEVLALQHKNTGKVIGSLGLHDLRTNEEPQYAHLKSKEIGYVLSRDYWGQGLVVEALKVIMPMCFHEFDCEILACGHFDSNVRSKRVIEKAGFQFDKQGVFHAKQMGQDFLEMQYVYLRSDWKETCFIRKAQLADALPLAAILTSSWESAYSDILAPMALEQNTDAGKRAEMFKRMLSDDKTSIYIAFVKGIPCGLVSFGQSRDIELADHAEIIAIYVLQSHWGYGVGKTLMDLILSSLRQNNSNKVMLWVLEDNIRARRFYEKNGFVADGTIKQSRFDNVREVRYRFELGN